MTTKWRLFVTVLCYDCYKKSSFSRRFCYDNDVLRKVDEKSTKSRRKVTICYEMLRKVVKKSSIVTVFSTSDFNSILFRKSVKIFFHVLFLFHPHGLERGSYYYIIAQYENRKLRKITRNEPENIVFGFNTFIKIVNLRRIIIVGKASCISVKKIVNFFFFQFVLWISLELFIINLYFFDFQFFYCKKHVYE